MSESRFQTPQIQLNQIQLNQVLNIEVLLIKLEKFKDIFTTINLKKTLCEFLKTFSETFNDIQTVEFTCAEFRNYLIIKKLQCVNFRENIIDKNNPNWEYFSKLLNEANISVLNRLLYFINKHFLLTKTPENKYKLNNSVTEITFNSFLSGKLSRNEIPDIDEKKLVMEYVKSRQKNKTFDSIAKIVFSTSDLKYFFLSKIKAFQIEWEDPQSITDYLSNRLRKLVNNYFLNKSKPRKNRVEYTFKLEDEKTKLEWQAIFNSDTSNFFKPSDGFATFYPEITQASNLQPSFALLSLLRNAKNKTYPYEQKSSEYPDGNKRQTMTDEDESSVKRLKINAATNNEGQKAAAANAMLELMELRFALPTNQYSDNHLNKVETKENHEFNPPNPSLFFLFKSSPENKSSLYKINKIHPTNKDDINEIKYNRKYGKNGN